MGATLRVKFLGTSAGELYPGMWCRCANCEAARAGSPRDRRQSAALYIESKLVDHMGSSGTSKSAILIDFPSEIAVQAERHNVSLPEVEHLLVTHSHGDHWFPYLLRWRSRSSIPCEVGASPDVSVGGARFTELPLLHVYGNSAVEAVLKRELGDRLNDYEIEFHPIHVGQEFAVGDFGVSAVAANHDVGREDAVHYVISSGDRCMLYGLDGDTFLPAARGALQRFKFDLVVMESTYGHGNGKNHRNFERVIEEADWLRTGEMVKSGGTIVATHFSPHHCPPHQLTEAYLANWMIDAAWDGMEIEV